MCRAPLGENLVHRHVLHDQPKGFLACPIHRNDEDILCTNASNSFFDICQQEVRVFVFSCRVCYCKKKYEM